MNYHLPIDLCRNRVGAILLGILLGLSGVVQAQTRPFITGLDKTTGAVGEQVTISGLEFPASPNLQVSFGGVEANVVTESADLLVVEVPSGAQYGPISVTNTSNGLTGFSSQLFLLSFGGTSFDIANVGAQQAFTPVATSTQPFDLTVADFDGDGLMDMAQTNDGSLAIDLFLNTSTTTGGPGPIFAIDFTASSRINPGPVETRNIDSGDLDGDGLPDIVASEGSNNDGLVILLNTSTTGNLNFANATGITLPEIGVNSRIARRPKIADLDGDGRPEIIISNETDNTIHIYQNNSTIGAISFSNPTAPITIVATGVTVGISGLDVADLNNDGFPEVVANPFVSSTNLFVFRNTSSPGTISFEEPTAKTAPDGMVNSVVGDFDGDGLNDIATSNVIDNNILVFRNSTTQQGGPISMEDAITVATNTTAPLGIGLGDLNGDGLLDMAVGHEQTTSPQLVALINTTTGTAISFSTVNLTSSNTSRNVKIADFNDDGRPDIAYTNNITTGAVGNTSVFRNLNCVVPTVEPAGPLLVCDGAAQVLETVSTKNMTYTWGGPVVDTDNMLNANMTGAYSVTIADGVMCSNTSNTVNVSIDPAPAPAAPTITSSTAPQCVGTDFQLTTSNTAQGYVWSGPGGFSSTEQNPTLTNLQPEQAGTYTLQLQVAPNGCLSDESTTVVTVDNVPEPSVTNTNGPNFCDGNTITLTTAEFAGFTYSWNLGGTTIPSQTTTSLAVTASGSYSVTISDGICSLESGADVVTAVPAPNTSFTSVDAICVSTDTEFAATSTGTAGFTLNYSWSFNSTDQTTMTSFATPAATDVTLTTAYDEVANCASSVTRSIDVQAVPVVEITVQDADGMDLASPFEKCPSDEVTLSISSDFLTPSWTLVGSEEVLGEETSFATMDEGSYAVTASNTVRCVINAQVDIADFEDSGLEISSMSTIDENGVIELIDGQEEVMLTVSGGTDYMWTPEEIINDPTAAMITVLPFETESVLTVTGSDANGCMEMATVTIRDPFITPRRTFSPNGDGLGDECWEIANVSGLATTCTVVIFDSRGRRLLETQTPFTEDCVWDGNFSGNPVPEGVYYFAMSCEDNQFNRSGSILLAR